MSIRWTSKYRLQRECKRTWVENTYLIPSDTYVIPVIRICLHAKRTHSSNDHFSRLRPIKCRTGDVDGIIRISKVLRARIQSNRPERDSSNSRTYVEYSPTPTSPANPWNASFSCSAQVYLFPRILVSPNHDTWAVAVQKK